VLWPLELIKKVKNERKKTVMHYELIKRQHCLGEKMLFGASVVPSGNLRLKAKR